MAVVLIVLLLVAIFGTMLLDPPDGVSALAVFLLVAGSGMAGPYLAYGVVLWPDSLASALVVLAAVTVVPVAALLASTCIAERIDQRFEQKQADRRAVDQRIHAEHFGRALRQSDEIEGL